MVNKKGIWRILFIFFYVPLVIFYKFNLSIIQSPLSFWSPACVSPLINALPNLNGESVLTVLNKTYWTHVYDLT